MIRLTIRRENYVNHIPLKSEIKAASRFFNKVVEILAHKDYAVDALFNNGNLVYFEATNGSQWVSMEVTEIPPVMTRNLRGVPTFADDSDDTQPIFIQTGR